MRASLGKNGGEMKSPRSHIWCLYDNSLVNLLLIIKFHNLHYQAGFFW